jgi:microcystin-dependent protein
MFKNQEISKKLLSVLILCTLIFTFTFQMNPGFIPKDLRNTLRTSAVYDSAGLIALWSGPLNTIPAGWKLCDGTGGTINTTNRFVYSVDNMEPPGSTGGSTSHNHSYSTVPLHDHGVTSTTATPHTHQFSRPTAYRAVWIIIPTLPGLRTNTINSVSDSALHNHGGSTNSTGGTDLHMSEEESLIPPYYEMVFIEKETNDPNIPIGLIVIWAGNINNIPAGWELCNGSNGTPDLREKFIRGAPPGENPGTLGGHLTHNHTYTEIPSHTHTIAQGGQAHVHGNVPSVVQATTMALNPNVISAYTPSWTDYADVPHIHDISAVGIENCTTEEADNLPPYCKVAFIMNTVVSNALPLGVISMWGDSIANIPSGWSSCDGENYTPNLLNSFLQGVANGEQPGITGGSETHRHIYTEVPLHTHTVPNDNMRHRHQIWGPGAPFPAPGIGAGDTYYGGSGIFTTGSSNPSHNHDVLPAGSATPYTEYATSIPPYVKVIYIQKCLSLSNPSPQDGATDLGFNPLLSVDVDDLEGDDLNVSFYDASDDSLIGEYSIFGGTGTASATWSGLSSGTSYSWYVTADDGLGVNQSDTWSFTTNYVPNVPTNPTPNNLATGISSNPTLSVDVFDNDGDDLTVSFYNASDDSLIDDDVVIGGSGTASVTWSNLPSDIICTWYVIADDGLNTTQSSTWSFSTAEELEIPEIPPFIPLPDLFTIGLIVMGMVGILLAIIYLRRKKWV